MWTKPTVVGSDDGSVAALTMKACPLSVCSGGMRHNSVCGKSTSATPFEMITSSGWFPATNGWRSVMNTWIMFTVTFAA